MIIRYSQTFKSKHHWRNHAGGGAKGSPPRQGKKIKVKAKMKKLTNENEKKYLINFIIPAN